MGDSFWVSWKPPPAIKAAFLQDLGGHNLKPEFHLASEQPAMLAVIVRRNRSIRGRVPALTNRSGCPDQRIAPERVGGEQTDLRPCKVATRRLDGRCNGKNTK